MTISIVVEEKAHSFDVQFPGQTKSNPFHFVWLRDNCECSECYSVHSFQKLRSSSTIPLDVKPKEFTFDETNLSVTWSDAHVSTFPLSWLKARVYSDSSIEERRETLRPGLWLDSELPKEDIHFEYKAFMEDDKAFAQALTNFLKYGILFVKGCPTGHINASEGESTVEHVIKRIGALRETMYGKTFDVINIPKAYNLAFTAKDLGLHQDLVYYESVPPVQFLHCIQQSKIGGGNVFIDSYKAAERLKEQYPKHFETLLRVPMTFKCTNNNHNFYCQKHILYQTPNQYIGVNYGPQNHGALKVAPEDVLPFYEAFKQFSDLIHSTEAVFEKKLEEGELVMFDNRRVLHGRGSFNPAEPRRLKGAYMGMDELEDRLYAVKTLLKKHEEIPQLAEPILNKSLE